MKKITLLNSMHKKVSKTTFFSLEKNGEEIFKYTKYSNFFPIFVFVTKIS
jgi:hypothetical protein